MRSQDEVVAICTLPDVRCRIALDVIAAGKHVLLEKPPFSTLGEFRLVRLAAERAANASSDDAACCRGQVAAKP